MAKRLDSLSFVSKFTTHFRSERYVVLEIPDKNKIGIHCPLDFKWCVGCRQGKINHVENEHYSPFTVKTER